MAPFALEQSKLSGLPRHECRLSSESSAGAAAPGAAAEEQVDLDVAAELANGADKPGGELLEACFSFDPTPRLSVVVLPPTLSSPSFESYTGPASGSKFFFCGGAEDLLCAAVGGGEACGGSGLPNNRL